MLNLINAEWDIMLNGKTMLTGYNFEAQYLYGLNKYIPI